MERELDKTERISLQLIVAGLLIGPIVGFLYLFSVLGSGPRTYEWVTAPAQSGGRQFYPLTGVYAGILFLLYLCDAFLYWTTPKLVALRQFLLAVAAIAFVLSTIFVMENYAYMPVRARARGTPRALRSARAALHPRSRASDRVSRARVARSRACVRSASTCSGCRRTSPPSSASGSTRASASRPSSASSARR